jgi:hypothetical protein
MASWLSCDGASVASWEAGVPLAICSVSSAILSSEDWIWALRDSISASPSASLVLRPSTSLAVSADAPVLATGRAARREVVVDAAVPAVDSLLAGAAVVVPAAVRVVVAGRVVAEPPRELLEERVEVREAVVPAAAAGTREEVVVPMVLFSAVLPGLERVLVRLAVVVGVFLSSSLALMLGRLRWLAVVEEVVGLRRVDVAVVVEVGGRVGGLVRPPVGRAVAVVPAVLEAVVAVAPGRRTEEAVAVVVVVPARLAVAVAVALGVPLVEVEPASSAAAGAASKLSFSDMMGWTMNSYSWLLPASPASINDQGSGAPSPGTERGTKEMPGERYVACPAQERDSKTVGAVNVDRCYEVIDWLLARRRGKKGMR